MMRSAGVLIPVSALPSHSYTGTFGKEAYKFVDFISSAGLKWWQVLPLVDPDENGSPYQSCSAFAGSVVYIDAEMLGYDVSEKIFSEKADYNKARTHILKILKNIFNDFLNSDCREFEKFCCENAFWLDDYADFTAIQEYFGGAPWNEWDDSIKFRDEKALLNLKAKLETEIKFHKFCQYEFYRQWSMLKDYAAKKDVKIIGDIPIYVSYNSADVWASPSDFMLDKNLNPVLQAGVPPDMFSETGQLWGNPIYDWKHMECDDFKWWRRRISHNSKMYDMIRIDHFIGIVNYYAIPAENRDACDGSWMKGPGIKLIKAIEESRNKAFIIAEDLGTITEEVEEVLKQSGYPGMKLMEFAFGSGADNSNLPHNFSENCIVYGGTHDNETLSGYFSHQDTATINFAKDYLDISNEAEIPWSIIKSAFKSTAFLAIFQLQDYLGLDNFSRINTPSTTANNWQYRFSGSDISGELAAKIKKLTVISGR